MSKHKLPFLHIRCHTCQSYINGYGHLTPNGYDKPWAFYDPEENIEDKQGPKMEVGPAVTAHQLHYHPGGGGGVLVCYPCDVKKISNCSHVFIFPPDNPDEGF